MKPEDSIKILKEHSPLTLIKMERIQQDAKFGEQNHDDFRWLSILMEEVGEVSHAVCEQLQKNYSKIALRENLEIELIQVAAVCVNWIECLRRNDKIEK